jgi:hypothetical protein
MSWHEASGMAASRPGESACRRRSKSEAPSRRGNPLDCSAYLVNSSQVPCISTNRPTSIVAPVASAAVDPGASAASPGIAFPIGFSLGSTAEMGRQHQPEQVANWRMVGGLASNSPGNRACSNSVTHRSMRPSCRISAGGTASWNSHFSGRRHAARCGPTADVPQLRRQIHQILESEFPESGIA